MTHGEFGDAFQHSFPDGQADTPFIFLGGNVVQAKNFKFNKKDEGETPIPLVTFVFNQEGKTWVIDENTNKVTTVTPLTAKQYSDKIEADREAEKLRKNKKGGIK